ncbi:hypothetical protein LINPERHAP1_LOCUS19046 [Linum perenne]
MGLQATWDAGFQKVVLQLDSKVVVQILTGEGDVSHHHVAEVLSFRT